jgi:hypothetical protein
VIINYGEFGGCICVSLTPPHPAAPSASMMMKSADTLVIDRFVF